MYVLLKVAAYFWYVLDCRPLIICTAKTEIWPAVFSIKKNNVGPACKSGYFADPLRFFARFLDQYLTRRYGSDPLIFVTESRPYFHY